MPLEQRRKLLQGVFRAVPQKDFHFHAAKDLAMAETADYGFMLWDGLSKGTLNNIQWRIVFRWKDGNATDVRITDYH